VYYVITQGASLGDQVVILPFKGNETALDAIGQIEGLTAVSSTQMWLARPSFRAETGAQVLPIDWQAITKQADATTNYQILPGDRLYVAQDHLVNLDNRFAKFFSPIERLMGVTLLSTNTVQRIKFFHQFNGGSGFSGF
jgi:polysaccharide export outer membrane protein